MPKQNLTVLLLDSPLTPSLLRIEGEQKFSYDQVNDKD